jgi:hypothetical protein
VVPKARKCFEAFCNFAKLEMILVTQEVFDLGLQSSKDSGKEEYPLRFQGVVYFDLVFFLLSG